MPRFIHLHSSSRYDRSPASLESAVNSYIKDADLVTLTEVEYESREKVLRKVVGWGCATGDISPRNDAGIIWNSTIWKEVKSDNKVIAKEAAAGQAPVAATWVVLEHRATEKRIGVFVWHSPSSVQSGNTWSKVTTKVTAWNSALMGGRALVKEVSKTYVTDGVMIVSDWNLDVKRSWVRAIFKTRLPSFNLVWSGKNFPKDGTHTNRIIDFTLIRGAIHAARNPRIYRDDNSSDHQPYIETLVLS